MNIVIVDDQTSARTMLRHILEDISPELDVLDFGDPARPVDLIFVHANGFNAYTYRSLLQPLSGALRIWAPDLRGHGRTRLPARPEGRRSWKDHRDDLIALLDAAPPELAAGLRDRAGAVIAEGHTLRLLNLRRISRAIAGTGPGPEGNVTKLVVAEQGQRQTELGMKLAGPAAVTGQTPALTQAYLGYRAMTIAGGTSEITRNTIAERILGLPRDPLLK